MKINKNVFRNNDPPPSPTPSPPDRPTNMPPPTRPPRILYLWCQIMPLAWLRRMHHWSWIKIAQWCSHIYIYVYIYPTCSPIHGVWNLLKVLLTFNHLTFNWLGDLKTQTLHVSLNASCKLVYHANLALALWVGACLPCLRHKVPKLRKDYKMAWARYVRVHEIPEPRVCVCKLTGLIKWIALWIE